MQQTVTLDAGSRDGVGPQETVLNGQGLVGEVDLGEPADLHGAAGNRRHLGRRGAAGASGQIGWVTGEGTTVAGKGLLRLQVLDATAVLSPGQQLVTSASVQDRPYVPGVPVGVISPVQNRAGALTASAQVRPYADFTALGVVGIVVAPPAPRSPQLRCCRRARGRARSRP